MLFPTYIADNFFPDFKKVLDFEKKLKYYRANDGRWPGERTQKLHEVNYDFYSYVNNKILSLMYPYEVNNIIYLATMTFQKINTQEYGKAWIHSDDENSMFTSIIYISNHLDKGTSIYNLKKNNFYFSGENAHNQHKEKHYLNVTDKSLKENSEKHCVISNSKYEESVKINSKPNRILIFDAHSFHGAHNFNETVDKKEPRITLITFFHKIDFKDITPKYPISECNNF